MVKLTFCKIWEGKLCKKIYLLKNGYYFVTATDTSGVEGAPFLKREKKSEKENETV